LKLNKDTVHTGADVAGNPDWHYMPEQTDMSTLQGIGYIFKTSECIAYIYDLRIENLPDQVEGVAVIDKQVAGSYPVAEGEYTATLSGEVEQTYLETTALSFSLSVTNPMAQQNPDVKWIVRSGDSVVAEVNGVNASWTPQSVGSYNIFVKVGELAEKQVEIISVSYRAIKQGDLSITAPEGGEEAIFLGGNVSFTAALSQSVDQSYVEQVVWFVNNEEVENVSGLNFTFTPTATGDYLVSARIGDTVLTEDVLIVVTENRPTVSANSQNVTLTKGQTEIDLSNAYTVIGDMQYTVKLFCDGNELQNGKLTVANESKVYTVTLQVSGENFTTIEATFSVSVTEYVDDSTGGCVSTISGGWALLSVALLCAVVVVAKKRTND